MVFVLLFVFWKDSHCLEELREFELRKTRDSLVS